MDDDFYDIEDFFKQLDSTMDVRKILVKYELFDNHVLEYWKLMLSYGRIDVAAMKHPSGPITGCAVSRALHRMAHADIEDFLIIRTWALRCLGEISCRTR